MNKKFRKLILPLSILAAMQTHALGLGNLQVNSALGETLSGEIPLLFDGDEEIEDITVSLASNEDYAKVDLDKSYVPSNIKVEMAGEDNQQYIKISSKGPVKEPIISLLLVVDWANGHLLREYTLLLDPPLFNSKQIQQEYSDPVQTQTYEAPSKIVESSNQVTQTISEEPYSQTGQVTVQAGDTLWDIATSLNNGSGSRQKMMVAIFNNNPSAFYNNDMNLIKKGAVLDIPSTDQVNMISNGEAISEVRSHIQNWSRLQTQDTATVSDNSDYSIDYGIELVPPNDTDSSDSNNAAGTSTNTSNSRTLAELSQTKEELISSELENNELASRIAELEQIVKDQETALTLKDTDLASLQQQLATDDSNEETADDVWDEDTNTEEMAADTMDSDEMTADVMDSDEMATDTMDSDEMTADTMDSDEMTADTMDSDEMTTDTMDSDEGSQLAITEITDNASQQEEQPQEAEQPQVKEQSFMDKVLDYKFEGLIALGVLLLGLLGFLFMKRRGESDTTSDSGSFLDSISDTNENTQEVELATDFTLDKERTELDLSNLEDSEQETTSEDDIDIDGFGDEDEPDVVKMDDVDNDFELDMTDLEDSVEDVNDIEQDIDELDIDELDIDDLVVDGMVEDKQEAPEEESDDDDLDELDLDIDEDILEQEAENVLADEVQVDDVSDDVEEFSLDFELDDIDLDAGDLDEIELDLADDSTEQVEDDFELDLDLDIDGEDLATESEETAELVFDTDEDNSLSNDADKSEEHSSGELEFDLDEDLFNTDDLDLDLLDEEDDIDLTEGVSIPEAEFDVEIEDEEDIDIGLDFDDIIDDDAIDTKLDLARAYFEMGDIDGAKQMVTEIIEEGDEQQKAKAEELDNEIKGS